MSNWTVKGVLQYKGTTTGIPGLTVVVHDKDMVWDDYLGKATTSDSGAFSITFKGSTFGRWFGFDVNPEVVIRVYDGVRRMILLKDFGSLSGKDDVIELEPIEIPEKDCSGYEVTLPFDDRADKRTFISDNNVFEHMVDNAITWPAVIDAIENAKSSCKLSELVIDVKGKEQSPPPNGIPRELIMKFASGYPGEKKAPTLGTHVLDAMTGPIDAKSRIIVAELPAGTSLSDIQIFIAQSGSTGQVAAKSFLVGTLPTVMHAKNLIVDGKTAFVLGSPMQQKYYGDAKHKIKDAVRGEHSLGIKVPIHDVSAKVEGPVVEHIHNGFFVPHWNKGAPPTQQESAIEFSGSPPGSCKLQVVRSIGGTRHWTPMFEDLPKGEAGILEAYQRAIASAEDYIYFENQYFTCAAIVTALVLALKSKPNLHVIGLINPNLEMITLRYGYYQNRAIRRLYKELNTDERKRFRLYTLWTSEAGENGNPRLLRTYVHAKVAIVDDKWATVGSANLDGVSLLKNEYIAKDGKSATAPNDFANPEDSVDTSYRSSEINLLLLSPADKVRALKETLWREHLGISDSDPFPSTNPGALWRETAGRRLGTLCGSTPTATDPARILPWPVDAEDMGTEATSLFEGCGEYLGALSTSDGRKIDFSKVKVEERGSSFSFATAEFKA